MSPRHIAVIYDHRLLTFDGANAMLNNNDFIMRMLYKLIKTSIKQSWNSHILL